MKNITNEQLINIALFNADPYGTCCVENEKFNEYSDESEEIAELVRIGVPLKDAIIDAFTDYSATMNNEVKQKLSTIAKQLDPFVF